MSRQKHWAHAHEFLNKIFYPFSGARGGQTDGTMAITILVVDDEEVIRNLAKILLSRNGFQVLLAENGSKACELFEKNKDVIDLIVLDLIMPGMDGKETYEKLRQLSPGIRVVISSGFSTRKTGSGIPEILEQERTGFVQKPYDMDMLIGEVTRVLALKD